MIKNKNKKVDGKQNYKHLEYIEVYGNISNS